MTHTTTDAAEARARTDADLLRLIAKDHERLAPNAHHSAETLRQIANRLATAEAASGAGEREAIAAIIDPVAMKSMEAHTAEWQTWVDEQRAAGVLPDAGRMTPDSLVRELASKDYDAQANARTQAMAKADAIRTLASLPPATDPAMGLDPVTVGRCVAMCEQLATGCRAELKDPANDARTISVLDGYIGACTTLARNIAALAAAPTIPATGEGE